MFRSTNNSFVWFLCFQLKAYSGERTNSLVGTPVMSRTTITFFVQLNNIKAYTKIQVFIYKNLLFFYKIIYVLLSKATFLFTLILILNSSLKLFFHLILLLKFRTMLLQKAFCTLWCRSFTYGSAKTDNMNIPKNPPLLW